MSENQWFFDVSSVVYGWNIGLKWVLKCKNVGNVRNVSFIENFAYVLNE